MATEVKRTYALHPGVLLADDLETLGYTQKQFSEMTGISRTIISDIINGKRRVSASIALKFETFLYYPANFWLNVQTDYDLFMAREEEERKLNEIDIIPYGNEEEYRTPNIIERPKIITITKDLFVAA